MNIDSNNFTWRGAWRDPVNDPPKGFVPVIVCREKAKGEYIVEQGCKDVGDWWKVYGTRIKAKSVIGWQPFPDAVKVVRSVDTVDVLKRLLDGEWVDTEEVKQALGIDFATGCRLFDLSRTAKWNPPPLNGQKITTKFRLKAPYCPNCGAKMEGK